MLLLSYKTIILIVILPLAMSSDTESDNPSGSDKTDKPSDDDKSGDNKSGDDTSIQDAGGDDSGEDDKDNEDEDNTGTEKDGDSEENDPPLESIPEDFLASKEYTTTKVYTLSTSADIISEEIAPAKTKNKKFVNKSKKNTSSAENATKKSNELYIFSYENNKIDDDTNKKLIARNKEANDNLNNHKVILEAESSVEGFMSSHENFTKTTIRTNEFSSHEVNIKHEEAKIKDPIKSEEKKIESKQESNVKETDRETELSSFEDNKIDDVKELKNAAKTEKQKVNVIEQAKTETDADDDEKKNIERKHESNVKETDVETELSSLENNKIDEVKESKNAAKSEKQKVNEIKPYKTETDTEDDEEKKIKSKQESNVVETDSETEPSSLENNKIDDVKEPKNSAKSEEQKGDKTKQDKTETETEDDDFLTEDENEHTSTTTRLRLYLSSHEDIRTSKEEDSIKTTTSKPTTTTEKPSDNELSSHEMPRTSDDEKNKIVRDHIKNVLRSYTEPAHSSADIRIEKPHIISKVQAYHDTREIKNITDVISKAQDLRSHVSQRQKKGSKFRNSTYNPKFASKLGGNFNTSLVTTMKPGEAKLPLKYSYTVSIQRKSAHYASGALLSKKYVISSAREFYFIRESIRQFRVRYGSANLKRGPKSPISLIIIHPGYHLSPNYDVSLLKLAVEIPANVGVVPIGIATDEMTGENFVTTYWARLIVNNTILPRTAKERFKSRSLRVSKQRLLPSKFCAAAMSKDHVQVVNSTLCMKPIVEHHSVCLTDPGAPVVLNGFLYGITSSWVPSDCQRGQKTTIAAAVTRSLVKEFITATVT